jgi:diguanylate cyclase (GGDEF)-like protein
MSSSVNVLNTPQDVARYAISRFGAEFRDLEVESGFRNAIRGIWVRDTRRAMVMAALFYLAFAISDVLLLGPGEALNTVLLSRFFVCVVGLTVAYSADRFSDALVSGISPTIVVALAMLSFLSFTLLFPFDVGWHSLGMMLMLLGTYVFIPNRFLPALGVALTSTALFIWLMVSNFDLNAGMVMILSLMFIGMNLFSAVSAFRASCLIREHYRDEEVLRAANNRLNAEIANRQRLESELLNQVHYDELTGISNQKRLQLTARQALAVASRAGHPVTLLLLQVDYANQLNDSYGRAFVDAVLKQVAQLTQALLGEQDELARIGAEEFAVLLPLSNQQQTSQLAQNILWQMQKVPVQHLGTSVRATLSIGLVQWQAGETLDDLIKRAGECLKTAKVGGGNRIEVG